MNEKPPARPPDTNGNGKHRSPEPPRSRGRVTSLEQHVNPEWWRTLFNADYIKTDSDVIEDHSITASEVNMIARALALNPEHHILDLACGQGRHSLELARRGYKDVEGLDRSHYLIQLARRLARGESLALRFREGDARKLPYTADTFDRVFLAGNSFGYFQSADDDLRLLKEVARVLKPGGRFLVDVTDANYIRRHLDPRSWEWIDERQYVIRERSLAEDGSHLTSREIIADIENGVLSDQFYSERLYDAAALEKLLRKAGFTAVEFHGLHQPDSKKKQDTGMMGHRIIMTGVMEKAWSPVRRSRRTDVRNIVVVQGDPRKLDTVKPGATWDDDDYQTLELLKLALSNLEEFRFTFLDNHDTLQTDLARRSKGIDIALNLCDEGFRNDAHMELHVPALLDSAGIRYTGAGPQCLAYCYDKSLVRGAAREMGVPVAEGAYMDPGSLAVDLPFGFPVIVKPNYGDSSVGITQKSVAYDEEELINALRTVRERTGSHRPVLVEQFLTGNDMSIGIIGNPDTGFNILPITEEDYSALPPDLPRICGYEAKWDPSSPYWDVVTVAADIPESAESIVVEGSTRMFERLGCRDYARCDWRMDSNGIPRLLEVNPNPGWCWDGHLAKMCLIAGIAYPDMLRMILHAAEARYGQRSSELGRVWEPVSRQATLDQLRSFPRPTPR